jgi:hypothetical protein
MPGADMNWRAVSSLRGLNNGPVVDKELSPRRLQHA